MGGQRSFGKRYCRGDGEVFRWRESDKAGWKTGVMVDDGQNKSGKLSSKLGAYSTPILILALNAICTLAYRVSFHGRWKNVVPYRANLGQLECGRYSFIGASLPAHYQFQDNVTVMSVTPFHRFVYLRRKITNFAMMPVCVQLASDPIQ